MFRLHLVADMVAELAHKDRLGRLDTVDTALHLVAMALDLLHQEAVFLAVLPPLRSHQARSCQLVTPTVNARLRANAQPDHQAHKANKVWPVFPVFPARTAFLDRQLRTSKMLHSRDASTAQLAHKEHLVRLVSPACAVCEDQRATPDIRDATVCQALPANKVRWDRMAKTARPAHPARGAPMPIDQFRVVAHVAHQASQDHKDHRASLVMQAHLALQVQPAMLVLQDSRVQPEAMVMPVMQDQWVSTARTLSTACALVAVAMMKAERRAVQHQVAEELVVERLADIEGVVSKTAESMELASARRNGI